jgi:hypothetical protein
MKTKMEKPEFDKVENDKQIATTIVQQFGGLEVLKDTLKIEHIWIIDSGMGMICEATKEVKDTFETFIPAEPFGYRIEVFLNEGLDLYEFRYHKVWYAKDLPREKQFIHENNQHVIHDVYNDMLYPMLCEKLGYEIDPKVEAKIWKEIQPKISTLS